jgi:hypothetical protein
VGGDRETLAMRSGLPIVVGGCHRSGTSLIRRVLNAHHRIYCGPEVKFFRDFHDDYFSDPLRHLRFTQSSRALLPEDDLLELLGSAFVGMHERAAARAGKARWADKNPENVLYLAEWQRLLGNGWLLIHVVRNPLDTIASIKEAVFPLTIPGDLGARVDFFKHYTTAGLDFAERFPDRYYRVFYEDVVATPRATLTELMSWLGEEFESAQLAVGEEGDGSHGGPSPAPVLEDPKIASTSRIEARGVSRWRHDLTPEEASFITHKTGALWSQIGGERRYRLWATSADAAGEAGPAPGGSRRE